MSESNVWQVGVWEGCSTHGHRTTKSSIQSGTPCPSACAAVPDEVAAVWFFHWPPVQSFLTSHSPWTSHFWAVPLFFDILSHTRIIEPFYQQHRIMTSTADLGIYNEKWQPEPLHQSQADEPHLSFLAVSRCFEHLSSPRIKFGKSAGAFRRAVS